MSNEIRHLLEDTFGHVGAIPPETAVYARARRHRRGRLFGASGAVAVVALAIGIFATSASPPPRVSATGLPTATSSVEAPAREAVPAIGAPDVDEPVRSTKARSEGQAATPVSSIATPVPPVTLPGQSPPTQHVFTPPPSGTRLYFLSGGDLVSTRLDGTGRAVVLSGYLGTPVGVWPDGTKMLMTTTQGGGANIVVLDLRTGDRKTVVHRDQSDLAGVALSPDGRQIAYSAYSGRLPTSLGGYTSPNDVHIVNVDGTGDRVLVHGEMPIWAPDSATLLVQACGNDGSGRPCTIKADGSGLRMLSGFPYVGEYSWSPDGQFIAGRDSNGRLSIARLDGSQLRTIGKAMGSSRPAWTPDGARIIYQREPDGVNRQTGACGSTCDPTFGISSAAVDGSGDVQFTTSQNDGFPVIG